MHFEPEAFEFTTRRGIVYAHAEGRPLRMTLYIPDPDDRPQRPGMVLIHGGAWLLGTRYQQAWYCRQFARAGFVVMTIDYRLMPSHAFPKCLHDSKAAVRWLRLHAGELRVDPERIVTFGASAGGHLAAFLAVTGPEDGLEGPENPGARSDVLAAISLYGAVDLTCYRDMPTHGPLNDVTRRFLDEFSGREGFAPEKHAWEAASPITYARREAKPIFFVHGRSDRIVHFEQTERFHRRLQELGVPTGLVALPNRGHGFDYIFTRQRREVFGQMLSFLGTHVPEREGDESADAGRLGLVPTRPGTE
ncbi:MAG: alpha/beta hydrolase [Candidatus Hydrogenedentes bacterium]|nr:alpha/beta hydrolase [Candidatus Hydrogenedentota bacterium]